jgi:hypothetical protein
MAPTRVPPALRARIGDDGTFGLIEMLDTERKDWSEDVLTIATDRFERRLTAEISTLRTGLQQTFHDGLSAIRQELATNRVEHLKWSFVFWAGQLAAMAGLLATMYRLTGR